MSDGGGGIVNTNPPAGREFEATEEGVGEGRVSPVNTGDGEGVLNTHEFAGTLLALASKVIIGEIAAVEALMSIVV